MGGKVAETCTVVIPINLEFSASVGFIHKDFFHDALSYDP